MASVRLEHIRKLFPNDNKRKKKTKEDNSEPTNLQITAEGVVAVQDFNIEIKDNEFIVLVGPSGCGKTTTLRMIAGLEEITSGDLFIDEKWINDVPPKDRDIAMVFQNYALYPHMTVEENIGFSLKIARVNKSEIKERVNKIAQILEVSDLLDRKPKALSGGQRQRVAIARAIIREPKVLLMDEPLSNLDAKLRNQTRAEIIKLRSKINTTFIYVTHDQTEAMTLGDRIVVMKDGFVQQIGTPTEVFNHPNNLFVAEFIGSPQMNRIENCLLNRNKDKYSITIFGNEYKLNDNQNKKLLENNIDSTNIILGIRPAHFNIGTGKIIGKVIIAEMMGTDVHIHVAVEEKEIVIIVPTNVFDKYEVKNGSEISIDFDMNNINIFDTNTKENLL